MKIDNASSPRDRLNSFLSIMETCIDVYKRVFAKENMRLVSVYRRFEENMFIENQAVEINEGVVALEELCIFSSYWS